MVNDKISGRFRNRASLTGGGCFGRLKAGLHAKTGSWEALTLKLARIGTMNLVGTHSTASLESPGRTGKGWKREGGGRRLGVGRRTDHGTIIRKSRNTEIGVKVQGAGFTVPG